MPDAPAPAPPKPLSAPQKALRKLGLLRPIDLALHLPLRYEDETRLTPLPEAARVLSSEPVQFEATVLHQEVTYRPRRQLLVTVEDGGERCLLRFFNFYPSQLKQLAVGARLRFRGELRGGFGGLTMMHPTVHAAGGALPGALTPVYPTVAQLPQAYLRKAVQAGLAQADLSATISDEFSSQIDALRAWDLRQALTFLHHPAADVTLSELQDHSHPAWQRLKAEELLAQQLSQWKARVARQRLHAPALRAAPGGLPEQLLAALPFELTGAQRRVGEEIARDLARSQPMHRLLQGDVGSGKTVVAALAACVAIDAGWQCALMAPTEILAEQHFAKLADWLTPLLAARGQCVAWLTGSQKKKERAPMLAAIESGAAALVIGTHAVIQAQVQFARLGLAIIDEQHRFGVAQRLALRKKLADHGQEPHMLMMSATPIPRTLAMSYYADLDVSVIDELPPGRTPIVTTLIADSRKDEVIERIGAQVEAGRQVYWVCPLIEESEALDLSNATATHADLSEALPGCMVGLLHSRMPTASAASPDSTRASMAARSFFFCPPASHATLRPRAANRGSSQPIILAKCCSARISVGAISAHCQPASMHTVAASAATTVLPEPTSPCSKRCMGTGRARSRAISSPTRRCAAVRLKGSTPSNCSCSGVPPACVCGRSAGARRRARSRLAVSCDSCCASSSSAFRRCHAG